MVLRQPAKVRFWGRRQRLDSEGGGSGKVLREAAEVRF